MLESDHIPVCGVGCFFAWAMVYSKEFFYGCVGRRGGQSMRAIKKIINNVAVCVDAAGRELVAFGKGIGFGVIPRDVPLREIERTFYDLDDTGRSSLRDLPSDVILFAAGIIDMAANELPYELSPNAALLLGDHISFILERTRKHINVRMPLAYDVQQTYPLEYKLAEYTVRQIRKEYQVGIPKEEAAGIAINLVNARSAAPHESDAGDIDMVEDVTGLVEEHFGITVDRESFNFARFATHLQYLFQRIHQQKTIDSENIRMYKDLRSEFPDISDCVEKISAHMGEKWGCTLSEEEKLYLILHVNRICAKEGQ